MENEQYMCYITYAVPAHMVPKLKFQEEENVSLPPPSLYPPGFMPQWYRSGSFPEDDFEE